MMLLVDEPGKLEVPILSIVKMIVCPRRKIMGFGKAVG